MKQVHVLALTALSCAVAGLSHVSVAQACGGCFHGSSQSAPSVVTGHRMALSLSPARTVLWDSVQYSGDPKEFAWVLPVGPGAYVEEASDAWFESLEAVTATHIMSPTVICNGQAVATSEGAGCGGSTVPEPDSPGTDGDTHRVRDTGGVTVEHEGTVGPYETVTLKADDPMALENWLTAHAYVIPADVQPVIDAYVKEKSEFIALRLKPGAGVREMKPVRVITPGASPVLPLRMVAAGTGAEVAIVLYVIAEGRYATANFTDARIDYSSLSWDWSMLKSNYSVLRDNAFKDAGFLTSYSASGGLVNPIIAPDGLTAQYQIQNTGTGAVDTYDNVTDLYFARAAADASAANTCAGIADAIRGIAPGTVVAEAPPGMPVPAGAFDSAKLACGGDTDIATALVGMHPADVWVTRLEANLPREKLATDLTMTASLTQAGMPNWHVATVNIGSPCPTVSPQSAPPPQSKGALSCNASGGRRSPFSSALFGSLAAFSVLLAARRLGKRARASK